MEFEKENTRTVSCPTNLEAHSGVVFGQKFSELEQMRYRGAIASKCFAVNLESWIASHKRR